MMKHLRKDEVETVRYFLDVPIPEYIYAYHNESIDLMDCYEVAFTFANALLRGKKINPDASPWGNGKSIIFEPSYTELLSDILHSNSGTEIENYCRAFLNVLDVFRSNFV